MKNSTTKDEIKSFAAAKVERHLDLIFRLVHDKFNTKQGDMIELQEEEYEAIFERLVNLITEQTFQNLH